MENKKKISLDAFLQLFFVPEPATVRQFVEALSESEDREGSLKRRLLALSHGREIFSVADLIVSRAETGLDIKVERGVCICRVLRKNNGS